MLTVGANCNLSYVLNTDGVLVGFGGDMARSVCIQSLPSRFLSLSVDICRGYLLVKTVNEMISEFDGAQKFKRKSLKHD